MSFLKRLFSKPTEQPEQPSEFFREDAPEWLITLTEDLADGSSIEVRLSLFASTRSGSAQVITRSGGELKQSVQVDATRQEFDRLMVILGFSFPNEVNPVPAGTDEAFVTITVCKREPFFRRGGKCNLNGWLDSRKPGPPLIEIGMIVTGIKRRGLPGS
ncbi:hypothetical protein [Pedosphaera parvula]|uniref:Uncharacterized protein n=1 Tax=Pedosphaera parvula (strain Ellin514) TaxID=320771 RepID=B9XL40_PEDPL|nr:hypothetical protein [Pedosphaera parvula]EEF59391.1 hypothetical protein Cflav_PD2235 [Pedosphaera parvula Ellin514]